MCRRRVTARSASTSRLSRYPFQACKALTTNSKFILNHIFASEGGSTTVRPGALEQVMRFLDTKAELNLVLAGYVSEFLAKLLEVYYTELSKFILENTRRTVLLVQHMCDVSVAHQVVFPLLFRGEKGAELENSVLEKKMEREAAEAVLRPLRVKVLKDLWTRCTATQHVEYINNVMWAFKEAVSLSTKDEKYKTYLYDTLYSKHIVAGLFEFMLATQVG